MGAERPGMGKRVGADREVGKLVGQPGQGAGDVALAAVDAQGSAMRSGAPPVRPGQNAGQHGLEYLGHAGHVHVRFPSVKPGAAETGLSIRAGVFGDPGHAQAGRRSASVPVALVMGLQQGAGVVADADRPVEGGGDGSRR